MWRLKSFGDLQETKKFPSSEQDQIVTPQWEIICRIINKGLWNHKSIFKKSSVDFMLLPALLFLPLSFLFSYLPSGQYVQTYPEQPLTQINWLPAAVKSLGTSTWCFAWSYEVTCPELLGCPDTAVPSLGDIHSMTLNIWNLEKISTNDWCMCWWVQSISHGQAQHMPKPISLAFLPFFFNFNSSLGLLKYFYIRKF